MKHPKIYYYYYYYPLTLPRQMGGRGLIDITRLHDKQAKLLQTYFLNKQVTSSLQAEAVKADDRCTPLDYLLLLLLLCCVFFFVQILYSDILYLKGSTLSIHQNDNPDFTPT